PRELARARGRPPPAAARPRGRGARAAARARPHRAVAPAARRALGAGDRRRAPAVRARGGGAHRLGAAVARRRAGARPRGAEGGVSAFVPVTPLADPRRRMPPGAAARRAEAEAAVASLVAEQRRLEALGLEWPLARAAHQLRYWRFVRALLGIA